MRPPFYLLFLLFLIAPYSANASFYSSDDCPAPVCSTGAVYETAFTPDEQLSALVVKTINSAKSSIKVAAHRFASKDISIALLNVARAKKDVKIILDKNVNSDGYSSAGFFVNMSASPHYLPGYDNQYQDYIIVDDKDIILGNISSVTDTPDEKKNAASVLVIHNAGDLAKKYADNWSKLWASSQEMQKKK